MQILCECEDMACSEHIELSMDEVLFLRGGQSNRYILVPGHESVSDEIVGTDSLERFVVVESDD